MKDEQINKARALYYAMFSRFFVFTTDTKRYFELVDIINLLKQNPLDTTTKNSFERLSSVLKSDSNITFMNEFDDIFHSPETKTIRTTASYYHEQVESGRKRIEMQNFLSKTKIRRDEKKYTDYEDHVGFIFTVLSELCELESEGNTEYENTIHCIFAQILNQFIDDFSKELYEHESAVIFKDVVVLLKAFIEFERIYLEVSKPTFIKKTKTIETRVEISEEEKERRARNKAMKAKGPKNKSDSDVFVTFDVENDI